MPDRTSKELEAAENWDFENPEPGVPVKNRRTVVSVSFPSEAFRVVSTYAQSVRMKTSEFIREAAIDRASPQGAVSRIVWRGGTSGSVVFHSDPDSATNTVTITEPVPNPHVNSEAGQIVVVESQ